MSDSQDEVEDENNMRQRSPESHEIIQKLTCDWKLLAILGAYVNRCLLENIDLTKNMVFKDKKLVTSKNTGDPTILKVSNVDVYSINVFRQIHHGFDTDMTYLQQRTEAHDASNAPVAPVLDEQSQVVLSKLSTGLMTLNEQIVNFIAHKHEELYDSKIKKIIEYLLKQRDYYISLGKNQTNDIQDQPRQYISDEHLNFAINVNNILGNLGPENFYDAINVISTALFILQSKKSISHTINITTIANDLLSKSDSLYRLNRAEVVCLLYYIQQNMDTICISTETDDIPTWSIREDIFQKLLIDSKKYTSDVGDIRYPPRQKK